MKKKTMTANVKRNLQSSAESRKRNVVDAPEFQVSERNWSRYPDITAFLNNTFVEVWETPSGVDKVRARFYKDGNFLGPIITVNTDPVVNVSYSHPAITVPFDGTARVVWICDNGLCARKVNSDGSFGSPQFTVSTGLGEYEDPRDFIFKGGYGFIWRYRDSPTANWVLKAKIYNLDDSIKVNEFTLWSDPVKGCYSLSVDCGVSGMCGAAITDGKLWIDSKINIIVRWFLPDGNVTGSDIEFSNIQELTSPYLVATGDSFTLAYAVVGTGGIILERSITPGWTPGNGTVIYKDTTFRGNYGAPCVVRRENGDYIIIWGYANESTNTQGVSFRTFNGTLSEIEQITQSSGVVEFGRCVIKESSFVCTWRNKESSNSAYIAARIINLPPIFLPGMIDPQAISGITPDNPVVLTVGEFFSIDTTNTTALTFDTIEITDVDPSLRINWYDTKQPVITVTKPDIETGREIEITSNGENPNPTIVSKTCNQDGTCSEETTTTLATAFSLGSENGEQIPTWLKAGGGIGAGVLVAGIVGLGIFAVCRHNKKQKPRRQQTHETLKRHAKFGQTTDEALSENPNTQSLMP